MGAGAVARLHRFLVGDRLACHGFGLRVQRTGIRQLQQLGLGLLRLRQRERREAVLVVARHRGEHARGRQHVGRLQQRLGGQDAESTLPKAVQAFGISGSAAGSFGRLFMSHPPIEERIAALQQAA